MISLFGAEWVLAAFNVMSLRFFAMLVYIAAWSAVGVWLSTDTVTASYYVILQHGDVVSGDALSVLYRFKAFLQANDPDVLEIDYCDC